MKRWWNVFTGDAGAGCLLLLAAILAMILANSGVSHIYTSALEVRFGGLNLQLWVNDLLMAIFFLYVGLEIKREALVGALSTPARMGLPVVAAIGGMIVPAIVYLWFAGDGFSRGWAIPSATDIAFALGVFALVGSRLPLSVRALLLAIAVVDDLGAILIIAFFYSGAIGWMYLAAAALVFGVLYAFNRMGVKRYLPYLGGGLLLWWLFLMGGVHPTLAGVLLGFSIPMQLKGLDYSPLEVLEHRLHPFVMYGILPVFALFNAGVALDMSELVHPVSLGIGFGLSVGKVIGIFGVLYLAIKSPFFLMPDKASYGHLLGMSLLCGIGFTMALFIGNLAFATADMASYVRVGVLGGSLLSAILGYGVLRYYANQPLKVSYE